MSMRPTLEPSGVHVSPKGWTRYAIWIWTDGDGEQRLPCAVIDVLDRVPDPPAHATCADPRQQVAFGDRKSATALFRIMHRAGLVDDEQRLTEKGSVIRFAFQRRDLVRAGIETPHGLRKRPIDRVPF